MDDDRWTEIRGGLGPDPLHHPPGGADVLAERLARRSVPIGRALLDQKVMAGLGNVYRVVALAASRHFKARRPRGRQM